MAGEEERARAAREHELRNLEVLEAIFVSGSPSERKEVQDLHHLTEEQMELCTYYARLRHAVIVDMGREQTERLRESPEPTEEERSAGVFREHLEPQVRDATFLLRQKGYNTYSSGFWGFEGAQHISCDNEPFRTEMLPSKLIDELKQHQHVTVRIEPQTISFTTDECLTVEELTYIWNKIAEALPDLGAPAPDARVGTAEGFRARHQKTS